MKYALILAVAFIFAVGVPFGYIALVWLPEFSDALLLDLRVTGDRMVNEISLTRIGAMTEISALGDSLDRQGEAWRRMVDKRLASVHGDVREVTRAATGAIEDGRVIARENRQQIRHAIDQAAANMEALQRMTPPIQQQLDRLGDCNKNPRTCLAPIIVGTATAFDRAMARISLIARDVKAETPQTLAAARGTFQNAEKITGEGARIAPQLADNSLAISGHIRKVTHRLASPLRYVLGGLKAGAKRLLWFLP